MIEASSFFEIAGAAGFRLYTGVPCSSLGGLFERAATDPALRFVPAANEGDAVALAGGAALGGVPAVAMLQNSGLGNAVNPLTSLSIPAELPVLLVVSWRGDPEGAPDEPQHRLMGEITPRLLDLCGVPWAIAPVDRDAFATVFARAVAHLAAARTPFALIVRRPLPSPRAFPLPARPASSSAPLPPWVAGGTRHPRAAFLEAVQRAARPDDVVIATTGHTGRELYGLGDRPGQLYCVGAMGCASSLALGLAIARPERRVIVLDGDGAALMRLGALATIGHERPANLVHVLLDNERHDSTGGQPTVSSTCDLAAVAHACGYPRVERIATPAALEALLGERAPRLTFAHAKLAPGTRSGLPRPRETPAEVTGRLRRFLEAAP